MTDAARQPLTEEGLEQLLAVARLPLTPERKAVARPALELIYSLVDSLDGIDLGETPPATAFDPRWE